MIELALEEDILSTVGVNLKVIGVGGAGGNAVNSMVLSGDMPGIQFIVANTDAQALNASPAHHKIQLGKKITKGLGAGSNPDVGRRAAEEDIESIKELLIDTDILFLTAGLGGGTGTGALPVIAQAAKELGVLTVAIVTKPFTFEGKRRAKHAEEALKAVKNAVDTMITVPNQKLLEFADPKISMLNAFALSNDILKHAIKGISDIITKAGHINVDFADVRTIMKDTGYAIMGTGKASGPDRARQAALKAISSPLLENASIHGARGVLINITGNSDLELMEINEAASLVYDMVSPDANIIMGSVIDTTMGNEISVTIIATGLSDITLSQSATDTASTIKIKEVVIPSQSVMMPEPIVEKTVHVEEIVELAPLELAEQHHAPVRVQEQEVQAAQFDMNDFDTPTFLRKKSQQQTDNSSES